MSISSDYPQVVSHDAQAYLDSLEKELHEMEALLGKSEEMEE